MKVDSIYELIYTVELSYNVYNKWILFPFFGPIWWVYFMNDSSNVTVETNRSPRSR